MKNELSDEQILAALATVTHDCPAKLPQGWSKFARAVIAADRALRPEEDDPSLEVLALMQKHKVQHDEIAALKAELARPEATFVGLMRAEIAALKAERDALREDAGRYRFLRAQPIGGEAGQPVVAMPNGMSSGYYLNEETADFAIDAAMAKE